MSIESMQALSKELALAERRGAAAERARLLEIIDPEVLDVIALTGRISKEQCKRLRALAAALRDGPEQEKP